MKHVQEKVTPKEQKRMLVAIDQFKYSEKMGRFG